MKCHHEHVGLVVNVLNLLIKFDGDSCDKARSAVQKPAWIAGVGCRCGIARVEVLTRDYAQLSRGGSVVLSQYANFSGILQL